MNNIEAVIFDWAGTTVDYGCFAPVQAFVDAFKKYGVELSMAEVREPMGMAKKDHVRTMLQMERISKLWEILYGRSYTEEDVENLYQESERLILEMLKHFCQPKPYVLECVEKMRSRGIKIGSTTGYNDEMMKIVVPGAQNAGYSPDVWVSPDSTDKMGRPYPYMIFKNMELLGVKSVRNVLKVGDTVADIIEGQNAGVITVGIVEGSSLMALTETEYNALSDAEQEQRKEEVRAVYKACRADYVIDNMSRLNDLIIAIEDGRKLLV